MTAEEFKINFYKDLEIVPFDNERDTNLMVKNHIFKGIYQCLVNQEKIMKMLNKKQFIKNIVITLIIGLSLISCAEDTPQELRAKAKQMEEKAAQKEKVAREEARRKALHRQTPREAIEACERHGASENQIFYIDGHKYRMWWGTRGHGEHMAVEHDPECEMNDIKKIILGKY